MKDIWRSRYRELSKNLEIKGFSSLTAFNAQVNRMASLGDQDFEIEAFEASEVEAASNMEEVKRGLGFAVEEGKNLEIDVTGVDLDVKYRESSVGGEAAEVANFYSRIGGDVTFYTPFLSEGIAEMLDEQILHPVYDDGFSLKKVRDAANTDRTGEKVVMEYSNGKTGRVVLSSRVRGFGPFFRSGVEENLEEIDEDIDLAFLSGFHRADGNFQAKIEKSRKQLMKLESFKHLEMDDTNLKKLSTILEKLSAHAESLGMDENEALKAYELAFSEKQGPLHLKDAYQLSKKFIEDTKLERVSIHTFRYSVVVEESEVGLGSLRDSLMFGELAAIGLAEQGEIPGLESLKDLEFEDVHVKRADELEEFRDEKGLEDFAKTGCASVEGLRVAAVPTLVHEDPERVTGLGDLRSAGSLAFRFDKVT